MALSQNKQNEVYIKNSDISSPLVLADKLILLSKDKASTTLILEEILGGAVKLKSSDIHFEPSREIVKIRIRIDGILCESGVITNEEYKYIVSRVKLLGGVKFNISEQAQDGRFTIVGEKKQRIETRVSINPSEYGPTIVLRIFDSAAAMLSTKDIGLNSKDLQKIEFNLKKPNGMILVTGPTGSGKTTTLYSFINSVNSPEIKIITIEDPIEYHLDGVQQTQIDASAGYTFQSGLKSILRQDPDVILVGEIRDSETAEIAIQAALTGHIVFSTLHTNTASGAIPRLLDLKIKPHIIGPAINLIIAQRLVRKLCHHCRKEIILEESLAQKINKRLSLNIGLSNIKLYEPTGCEACINGYKGRIGIFEILEVDKNIIQLITDGRGEIEIEKQAVEKGFINMQEDGIIKACLGLTSLSEVEKVTGPIIFL